MKTFLIEIMSFTKTFLRRTEMILVLVLLVGFSGCVSGKSRYPTHWSPPVQDVSEADYSGIYNAALIQLLNGVPLNNTETTEFLCHFVINPEEIKYREDCLPNTDSHSIAYFPISNPDYDLKFKNKKEGLQIIYKLRENAGNPVAGYQKEYIQLSKARDGSLIVKKVGKVIGMAFLIFPVAASEYIWYRFYDGKVEILKNRK